MTTDSFQLIKPTYFLNSANSKFKMYDVKGSRAIITGSAQGLGKEYAKRLLENGCKVCLSDIDEVQGLETKTQFQKQFRLKGDGVCFVKCDITKKEDWSQLWEAAEKSLKGPIDILINNAGLSSVSILVYKC